jgi:hypothetical protein
VSCVLVVGLAGPVGCDIPQATTDEVTCTDLCRCLSGLPSSQARCEASCLAAVAPVTDECAQCTAENAASCAATIADCLPLCTSQPTPLQGEP